MSDTTSPALGWRRLSRLGIAIAAAGALVQLVLAVYYLAMAHSPSPHDLPVGVVGNAEQQAQVAQLEEDGEFEVEAYDSADALRQAIREREAYGGVAFDGTDPVLYVASAASPSVASLFRAEYAKVHQERVAQQVAAYTNAGQPVAVEVLAALTTPPPVTDVVPLPDDDSAGSSLGLVIQALCLGGSIASLALGRLRGLTERSALRGLGHAALLVAYAIASSAVALLAMSLFGVGEGAETLTLFGGLALISLAVTASTAAFVALVGPAGALIGALYFTVGLVISGTSIAPEMLPRFGHAVGQLLPPGAGATVARDAMYFPDAPTGGAFVVLALYSVLGLAVVLATNAAANRTRSARLLRRDGDTDGLIGVAD